MSAPTYYFTHATLTLYFAIKTELMRNDFAELKSINRHCLKSQLIVEILNFPKWEQTKNAK